ACRERSTPAAASLHFRSRVDRRGSKSSRTLGNNRGSTSNVSRQVPKGISGMMGSVVAPHHEGAVTSPVENAGHPTRRLILSALTLPPYIGHLVVTMDAHDERQAADIASPALSVGSRR